MLFSFSAAPVVTLIARILIREEVSSDMHEDHEKGKSFFTRVIGTGIRAFQSRVPSHQPFELVEAFMNRRR